MSVGGSVDFTRVIHRSPGSPFSLRGFCYRVFFRQNFPICNFTPILLKVLCDFTTEIIVMIATAIIVFFYFVIVSLIVGAVDIVVVFVGHTVIIADIVIITITITVS